MGNKSGSGISQQILRAEGQLPSTRIENREYPIVFSHHKYIWANRWYPLLLQLTEEGMDLRGVDREKYRGIIENIKNLINEQNYKPPMCFPCVRRPLTEPKFIGYKLVAIMESEFGYEPGMSIGYVFDKKLYMHAIALVELSITGGIVHGEDGSPIIAGQIRLGSKLCTKSARVNNVQFIGPMSHTLKLVEMMNIHRLELVSQFNSDFKYRIGYESCEPNFKKPGIGCIQGIHFFATKKDAIKYLNIGFSGIDMFSPIITECVSQPYRDGELSQMEIDRENIRDIELRKQITRLNIENDIQTPDEGQLFPLHMLPIPVDGAFYIVDIKSEEQFEEKENNCCICCQSIWLKNPFKTKCGHVFHMNCLKEWYRIKKICPLCRMEFTGQFNNI